MPIRRGFRIESDTVTGAFNFFEVRFKGTVMKVTLLMAITLDGKIGKTADHFPDWTGKQDKRLFADMSRKAGVVIMGSRTYDTIGLPLPGRLNVVMTRNPNRVSSHDNLIYTKAPPEEVLADIQARGYGEAILAGGALINSLFARAGKIDDIVVTISPKVFGYGISLFTEEISMDMELLDVDRLDAQRVILKYRVRR